MTKQAPPERMEIWGDIVAIPDLAKSILISALTTMICFFLAPHDNISLQLFFGLGGAVLGFLICTFLFKPKRLITTAEAVKDETSKEESE